MVAGFPSAADAQGWHDVLPSRSVRKDTCAGKFLDGASAIIPPSGRGSVADPDGAVRQEYPSCLVMIREKGKSVAFQCSALVCAGLLTTGNLKHHRRKLYVSIALTGFFASAVSAEAQVSASVSPVTGPPGSHAFNSVSFNNVPQDLRTVGYQEQEYFLSGLANAYQYANPTNPADDSVMRVQANAVPYVDRILVRAPVDPARFSGNVILEVADDIAGSESEVEWAHAKRQFLLNGDAYVAVTSLPTGVATLKAFNPTRYGALNWPDIAATKNACSDGPEQGIVFDIITSLGTLLKQNNPNGPLPHLHVRRVFISGYSGAAITLLTYDRVFGLHSPLFDGYFFDAGGTRGQINGCEAKAAAAARVQPPASTVSPVFQRQTASDIAYSQSVFGHVPLKSDDSNKPDDRYRYYEVAGAAHVDGDSIRNSPEVGDLPSSPGETNPQSFTESQFIRFCGLASPTLITAFPNRYVDDALWRNLEHWAAEGTRYNPPAEKSTLLINSATYSGLQPQSGGVRSPAVDVPIDSYANGVGQPTTDPASGQSACFLTGFQTPNGRSSNAASVVLDAVKLARDGFLTAYDLLDITIQPSLAYTFPVGTITLSDSPTAASSSSSSVGP